MDLRCGNAAGFASGFRSGGGNSITLHVQDKPLGEVLEQIEDGYGYRFVFRNDAVDLKRKVTVSLTNVSINTVLDRILGPDADYSVRNRQVVIWQKSGTKTEESPSPEKSAGNLVGGQVRDSYGNPIVGAFILEKGTRNGVSTDLDGNWSMKVTSADAVLLFSCLGFREVEFPASSGNIRNVTMEDDMLKLDDVVVIGYGTQTKATITGSLAVVDTKELIKPPVSSITNVLAGSVPGVATVQTTGQPGEDAADIYIRGVGSLSSSASKPLVLVDGV